MSAALPDLAEKFLAPAGWQTGSFTNPETGHRIHYGHASPQDAPAKAVIVTLPGLSEFTEKYFETAHDMLDRGYAFWCIDWFYQGHSGRHEQYPQRRHSDSFDKDLSDLRVWIDDHVKPAAGDLPLIMLAHSMGGKMGLRYLSTHQGTFNAAAFSAPFLGIYKITPFEKWAEKILTALPFLNMVYVPQGSDWFDGKRERDSKVKLTSDDLRDTIHGAWSKTDESLRLGDPTFGWVYESLQSFKHIRCKGALESIDIPVLLAAAGNELVVDNGQTRAAADRIPSSVFMEIPGARHEILMERDEYRNAFLSAFDKLLEDNKIVPVNTCQPV